MQGILVFALIIVAIIVLFPFIISLVVFCLLALGIFMLLARFGLLPGSSFKTYTYTSQGDTPPRPGRTTIVFEEDAPPARPEKDGWYQELQEGETIVLPEDALKKDDETD